MLNAWYALTHSPLIEESVILYLSGYLVFWVRIFQQKTWRFLQFLFQSMRLFPNHPCPNGFQWYYNAYQLYLLLQHNFSKNRYMKKTMPTVVDRKGWVNILLSITFSYYKIYISLQNFIINRTSFNLCLWTIETTSDILYQF